MAQVSEISITVKNDEKRLTKKSLEYDEYTVSENDPLIQELIREAVKEFQDEVTDVKIKITMSVR